MTNAHSQTPTQLQAELALEAALASFAQWRANKHSGERIPEELWRQIFALSPPFKPSKIRNLFSINKKKYDARHEELINNKNNKPNVSQTPLQAGNRMVDKLCEVLTQEPSLQTPGNNSTKPTPIYRPNPEQAKDTLVVEIFRNDGQRMCIHMTQQQIGELLQAFCPYQGEAHVATHAQA